MTLPEHIPMIERDVVIHQPSEPPVRLDCPGVCRND